MLSRFNFFPRLLRLCYGSLSLHVCFWQRKKVDCHWNIWLYLRMDFCTICSWIELFLLDARWLSPYASFTILKIRICIIFEFKPKIFKSTIISNFWMNNLMLLINYAWALIIGCSCARTKTKTNPKTKVLVRSGYSLWRTNQASVLWDIKGSVRSSLH